MHTPYQALSEFPDTLGNNFQSGQSVHLCNFSQAGLRSLDTENDSCDITRDGQDVQKNEKVTDSRMECVHGGSGYSHFERNTSMQQVFGWSHYLPISDPGTGNIKMNNLIKTLPSRSFPCIMVMKEKQKHNYEYIAQ